jgi:flagellar biosynthesis/type III secretory pathway M-ring protein FliF/YscJ
MSTALLIVIVVVVALVLFALIGLFARRLAAQRELERQRLGERAGGHRQEAELHASKASDLSSEQQRKREGAVEEANMADRHARLADEHRTRADELAAESDRAAERASKEGKAAGRHDEQAADLEERL